MNGTGGMSGRRLDGTLGQTGGSHAYGRGWLLRSLVAGAAWALVGGLAPGGLVGSASAGSAPADAEVQGEYVGEIQTSSGKAQYGVQVVARGKGNFIAVGFPGGLPGAGGTRYENKNPVSGHTADRVTRFAEFKTKTFRGSLEISGGVAKISGGDGEEIGRLQRTVRKSPTLGKKPPPGALVLFDGTTAEHFTSTKSTNDKPGKPATMTKEGLLSAKQGRGLFTRRAFQDLHVHLEFRLPFEPERGGQGRGNSGCYLQGRYEVQILDSFGLKGKHDECGGIYTVGDPKVNMCFPPLAWQTYDIEFTAPVYDAEGRKQKNALLTVHHNGVLVHEKVEVPKDTTAAPYRAGPEPRPLYFQNHGHAVLYRNIWVVEK